MAITRMRANWRAQIRVGRLAPTGFALAAVVVLLVCVFAPTAGASPASPMKPVITRVRLHDHRLWRERPRRLHGLSPQARAAIVGGSRISIEQAPWQVVVIAVISETEALLCGGSILNETEILTAGHCVYNPSSKERIPADQIVIGAGTEDIEFEPEQVRVASEVRVHPYYDSEAAPPTPDDVAVLELKTPLTVNTDVQPISLTPANTLLQEGAAVNIAGFGEENPSTEELNGKLYSTSMTLGYSRECGGEADALFLCASTPNGSLCFGDSGSGLTLPGVPAVLAGVADTVEVIDGQPCLAGANGGFVNVAAPEIRDFILEGNESPPRAPRGGGAFVNGTPMVGDALSCEPGVWTGTPTFTYTFINTNGGEVLQQGSSPTYTLTAADTGRFIFCRVLASNAGGTGVALTADAGSVRPTPQEEEAVRKKREEEEQAQARKKQEEAEAVEKELEEGSKQLKKIAEEAAAKHAAEVAAATAKKLAEEAASNHPHEEGSAKNGVLGTKEVFKPSHRTRAQLLASALTACKRHTKSKSRRAQCEARARKQYGSQKKGERKK